MKDDDEITRRVRAWAVREGLIEPDEDYVADPPTIEDFKRLVAVNFPGYVLEPGSKLEVHDGNITTYKGEVSGDEQVA